MSLILEALRKSEAERRLGQAPDLLAPMPVLRAPARRPRWPLWIAGVCVVIAAAAMGWWWTHAPIVRTGPVAKQSTHAASDRDANNDAASDAGDDASQASIASQPSQLPIISLPLANVPHPVAPIAATPTRKSGAALPTTTATPAPVAINATAPKLAAEPIATPAPPAIAADTTTPATADEPALLTLADLSVDERNGLPAMKVSMHVYTDDPAQRFMIVDGQRVGEGALLANGAILVHIRRDGAEIDVRGRRLLLPKP